MINTAVVGIDIGTSGSKGVLVSLTGKVIQSAARSHEISRPRIGWAEMNAEVWWSEFVSITRELLNDFDGSIIAVGVSGMGPCVLVTNDVGDPPRQAILYGVDSRATAQIASLTAQFGGDDAIAGRCGSRLSTQAVGPKLRWIAENEPKVFASTTRLFMPNSWLVWRLTGAYLLDHHSASQCTPMYDATENHWYEPWAHIIAPGLTLPELRWPGDIAGEVTASASAATGLPMGIPVILGTIDAWAEALSVGAHNVGDLMVMYGTTMFLVGTCVEPIRSPTLWTTTGVMPGTNSLAAGMATSGAITSWLRELLGAPDYASLLSEAEDSGVGARGLLMLPYFAGERTPIADPQARGTILGLTVSHRRGDLDRAALEATAFGVRHNIETMLDAGADIRRVVAVGGGTTGALWTQIVSDITGHEQEIPAETIGASLGAAFLAASALGPADIDAWNPIVATRKPRPQFASVYDDRYSLYREAYTATKDINHRLAALQERDVTTISNERPST